MGRLLTTECTYLPTSVSKKQGVLQFVFVQVCKGSGAEVPLVFDCGGK